MNESPTALPAFSAYGIELEYMIVDRNTLDVLPVTDEVIKAVAGDYVSEIETGALAWSNELVLHVIELKTNGPAASLLPLPEAFAHDVRRINGLLAPLNGQLMPSAMHPWMDPHTEMRLWPHEYNAVYESFDRIFDCHGHGWANLQSMHINLPFADDAEFSRLHAAIRVLLPLLPALAASSPIVDGVPSGLLDTRLDVYRGNCRRVPAIAGQVIPETVASRADYERVVLAPMYAAIRPLDPDGILQYEWLNARGAIARFDRNAIEIRVLDIQECPAADLALGAAIVEVLKALYAERWRDLASQQVISTGALAQILSATIADADLALIDDRQFLDLFGYPETRCEARELWQHLIESVPLDNRWTGPLDHILAHGPLARRMLRAVGKTPSRGQLIQVYTTLCHCLDTNRPFSPA